MTERILILRAGAIGDVVLSYPVLFALRARRPDAFLCLAGRTEARLLALAGGLADAERDIADAFFAPLFAPAERAPCRELAEFVGGFDRVVSLLGDPGGAIARALKAHGARDLVSFEGVRPGAHVARQLFAVLAPWGITGFPEGQAMIARALPCPEDAPAGCAVVHPGSGSAAKNWPAERFRALIECALVAGFAVRVPCGEADAEAVAAATDGTAAEVVRLPLVALAGLFMRAALYVGNDSGITHVAGAVGAPTVAVFGPSDPALWRPLGPRTCALRGRGGRFPGLDRVLAAAGLGPGGKGL
ncbi:MAG TPA: hypothetical protein DCM87_00790 [Planctomycetes bacterium]|nr:hypothetical protein [Planctomycetota bacterium]